MKSLFTETRAAVTALESADIRVSVGARSQANQVMEVIITQTGHQSDIMSGYTSRHVFTTNVIVFDKSYITAAELSDGIFRTLSNKVAASDGQTYTFRPSQQIMYYTDEDDFAVSLTVEIGTVG
jgi:hypothetical protein